jgi:sodium-dependent dicarboxylate transporter 2/3/5
MGIRRLSQEDRSDATRVAMNFWHTNLDKIQLIFIFINSFLISRLIITTKIPERLVLYLIGKKHLPIMPIVFYIIFASAGLSFFIPNVITALTLLPVIHILGAIFEQSFPGRFKDIETLLPLAIVYGANIGGMGSITGTPANAILVLYGALSGVRGIESMRFEYWLLWGIPFVAIFVLAAWAILSVVFRLWSYHTDRVYVTFRAEETFHPLQRAAVKLTGVCFVLLIVLSSGMKISSEKMLIFALTALSTLLLIALLFFTPIRFARNLPPQKFLTGRDCYSHLPMRGLSFVGIVIVLTGIGAVFDLQRYVISFFHRFIHEGIPTLSLFLVIAALTSFATEILSNTVVQLAMFTVVKPLFEATTFTTIQAFLIITLSCTYAFMTPIATGVNGLVFGEMKGIALTKMLLAGLMMKLVGVVIIALGVPYILGWLL